MSVTRGWEAINCRTGPHASPVIRLVIPVHDDVALHPSGGIRSVVPSELQNTQKPQSRSVF